MLQTSLTPSPPVCHAESRSGSLTWEENFSRKDVKHGPFSVAEKQLLKESYLAYAAERGLDPEHMDWLYHLRVGEGWALLV